jgi:hypothetical protein
MVMPFGIKPVDHPQPGAPDRIDFDRLWNLALAPLIEELGYDPVRADQDTSASILMEMLERLYFADMVVADMSLPNGNVYYEIGIRHASQRHGCVLISADWARPLFDTAQMRRLLYPLADGSVPDAAVPAIQSALRAGVRGLAQGESPMFQVLPGFPDEVDPKRAGVMRQQLDALTAFQGKVRTVRLMRDKDERRTAALALAAAMAASPVRTAAVELEVLALLRDAATWTDVIAHADGLPEALQRMEAVQELRHLAVGKAGQPLEAIAALEQLIERSGASGERHGLIGGRYKKLAAAAKKAGDEWAWRDHLDQAIRHYERGLQCDLNAYYCSCNLPRLYRERGDDGDEARASATAQVALMACERAKQRGTGDEWLNPTLLGLAFDAHDLAKARELVTLVRREGAAAWKLETTLADLETTMARMTPETRAAFEPLLGALRPLVA